MRQRMSLAFDSEHNVLILVSIIMLNVGSPESHYTKLGMFRLNMQNHSFEKILIVDIPHNSVSDTCVLSASGNLWAAIPDLLAGSVHIRSTSDSNHQGLVIDVNSELLGPELYRRVYFLSERSMLVFNPNAVAISDIPDPATKFSHGTTPIPTNPIWQQPLPSPCPSHRMYRNPISPIIWNSSTGRHEGPLVIYFGDHMQIIDSGDRDYSSLDDSCIRKYEIKWKGLNHAWHLNATLSSRRAFWLGADGLQACIFPYDYRGHNGHMRLGSNPPYLSSARVVPVDLSNIPVEDVCEASWDECSSRLCLLLQMGYSSEVVTLDL
ncbi:hypothetical protein SERLA73DRAFT_186901 [Serpula lacrymans var. lacrymans S7.3]|uniref:Uncharacterized protein n=2 Tax=Serpula lacrymans var. lacrymans TaxID=341189 RepID=F8Q829_SERL3|nr:uncharacterized protein SERLADRAFT_476178 [Serpula lacrymans var. lacrymans S7.9]EGN95717.1 hypothetical protein SERLA73DRAFT_186901 [Serpula lacrymans var. lacrymans S7.3]EGO21240.1 hypothetical protein SERLADRAFT_476178 [Serpula lacrymans var. lacrymans S7.9]